jgi:hypothetical protein
LQDAGPARQMAFGMFARPVARGVEQGGRQIVPAERTAFFRALAREFAPMRTAKDRSVIR